MTQSEKDLLCELLASLLSPPGPELPEEGRVLRSLFQETVHSCGGDSGVLAGLVLEGDADTLTGEMRDEYDRLFSRGRGEGVSLVESCYKPWTQDPRCSLSFASEQGLLMGDSAVHLLDVYRQFGLEVAEEFSAVPDHLVMELEFLACLYRWGTDAQVQLFVRDHLDWLPSMLDELEKVRPHSFYRSLMEVLDLFLRTERKRLEIGNDGEKSIH